MILDRIRRVTRDGRWIPEIDGLRFLAIVSVVLFHLAGEMRVRSGSPLTPEARYKGLFFAINNGDRGVELFFVISGMILAMPFARALLLKAKPVSLGKYYLRRVTRLEPPYVVSILAFTLMVFVFTHGHLQADYWRHALASLFYLHSLVYHSMSPVNPVTWSLEVEIQFYLFAPLVMQLFRIPGKTFRRVALAVLVLLLGLAQRQWLHSDTKELFLPMHLQYFIAGLFVADIFVLDLPDMRTSWLWDAAAVGALGLVLGMGRETWTAHIVLPFLFAVLCLAAMRSRVFRAGVANRGVAVIGGMCYSIYLLHFAVMAAVFKVSRRFMLPRFDYLTNYLIQCALVLTPILLLSVAFFLLVERPCMDPAWPGKLWHRLTGSNVDVLDSAGIAADEHAAASQTPG